MGRSKAIDILRAVAVVLVILRHMRQCPVEVSSWWHTVTGMWVRGGWIGVDLFFVLSGFLVSGLLFREYEKYGGISVKRFLIRRGFKIYPAFWVFICVTFFLMVVQHHPYKPLAVASELLFIQNYGPALWGHTWSLAVEEHFYFFLAFFLLLLLKIRGKKNPFRLVPVMFVVFAVSCLVFRVIASHVSIVFIDKTQLYPTHLRIDSLFCGVMVSYYYHCHHERFMAWARRWRWGLLVLALPMLALPFIFSLKTTPFIYTFGLTLFYLGSAGLMIALLTMQIPDRWFTRAVAYVGSHSYSIYLWHPAAAFWLVSRVTGPLKQCNWFFYFAAYVIGVIAFGIVMAVIIEFPLLRLRDRWFPSRGRALSVS